MSDPTNLEISPEPVPNFDVGRKKWGVLWPMHYNIVGVLFALILIYAMDSVVALCNVTGKFQRRKIFIVVNVLVGFFCLISSTSILIDPYNSGEHIENIRFRGILFLIISLKIPCLTSAFALIQISLLEAAKLQLYSKRIQNFRFIGTVILVHFFVVMTADLVLVFAADVMWLLVCCQLMQFLIGLSICCSSLLIGRKLLKTYWKSKQRVNMFANTKQTDNNYDNQSPNLNDNPSKSITINIPRNQLGMSFKLNVMFKDKCVKKISWIVIITSILGVLYCCCIVFSASSVFMFNENKPNAWNWFILETMFRIIELLMAGIMAYTVRRSTNILQRCFCDGNHRRECYVISITAKS